MYKSEHFNLGIITFSKCVNTVVEENKTFARAVTTALQRYCKKDWGKASRNTKKRAIYGLSQTGQRKIRARM